MKKARKLITFILATLMVLSMSLTAWADGEKSTITMTNGADDSVYSAYKLLDVTVGTLDGDEKTYAYTVNDKYLDILMDVTEAADEDGVIAYIRGLDDAGIRTFADSVYKAISEVNPAIEYDATTTWNDPDTEGVDESLTKNVFENVDQGYYLILETTKGSDPADTFSLVMLNTAGQDTVNVETKEDAPTAEKKIVEDSTTSDYTSAAVGDTINFEITGEVSSKYDEYESYYYSFTDTLSAGLTLNDDIVIVVSNNDVETNITNCFKITKSANNFKVESNLKEITTATINEDSKIIVRYTAELNENAVSTKDGNKNTVVLEYENDPYHESDGDKDPKTPNPPEDDPGKTPEDINVVFTFDTIVNKVDKDKNPLDGAGFTLYKQNDDLSWPATGMEINGETTFEFTGLDEGVYKLVETTVPDGYNKADDITFKIVPEYDTSEDPVTLKALKIRNADDTADITEFDVQTLLGTAEIDVENLTGSLLPSTGGIGTTIFYIVGGVLVLVAVVMLVTKKRMKEE